MTSTTDEFPPHALDLRWHEPISGYTTTQPLRPDSWNLCTYLSKAPIAIDDRIEICCKKSLLLPVRPRNVPCWGRPKASLGWDISLSQAASNFRQLFTGVPSGLILSRTIDSRWALHIRKTYLTNVKEGFYMHRPQRAIGRFCRVVLWQVARR